MDKNLNSKIPKTLKGKSLISLKHSNSTSALPTSKKSTLRKDTNWLEFKYDQKNVSIPKSVLFHDLACEHPIIELNVKGWQLNKQFFEAVHNENRSIISLSLDHCVGVTLDNFALLRGLKELRKLSLCGIDCVITKQFSQIIASFSRLEYLNMSELMTDVTVFKTISMSCGQLNTIILNKCGGLDDYGLYALSQCVLRFRTLEKISINNCSDFHDLGLLDFIVNSMNILKYLSVSNCANVSSLCLVGLRSKMSVLTSLNVSNMNITSTAFEWISEGCQELITLDLSRNIELDNVTLIQIGQKCRYLQHLNISRCLALSDEGIRGFFEKFFGTLLSFDISMNLLCGSDSAVAISTNCSVMTNLKLNGLSKISAPSLIKLFNKAVSMIDFEMCCELKTTTTHRSSMMPHFDDTVLIHSVYCTLSKVRLAGACMITDNGVVDLLKKCGPILTLLDVSYCHCITNTTLIAIPQYCLSLETLILTGCVKISNPGLLALSNTSTACHKTISEFQINGCSYITDVGMQTLSNMTSLTTLGIRSCDQVTDKSIISIAENCTALKSLDMINLDLVNIAAIKALVKNCIYLTCLNCESCAFTQREFSTAVQNTIPFVAPMLGKCKLEALPLPVIQYNKRVLYMRNKDKHTYILQRFCRFIIETKLRRYVQKLKMKRLNDMRRVFNAMRKSIRKSTKERKTYDKNVSATQLQKEMRRLMAVYYARRKARVLRKQAHARALLQRMFRGYSVRIRYRKKFHALYTVYNRVGHMVHKYWVLVHARRLHRLILVAQSFGRMISKRQNYLIARYGMCKLQRRFRRHYNFIYHNIQEKERQRQLKLLEIRKDIAIRLIQRNWKATYFNRTMSSFILTCCVWYRSDFDERQWNSTVLQRYWRGYMIRLKNYRRKMKNDLVYRSATILTAAYRSYYIRRQYIPWRDYKRYLFYYIKRMLLLSRPKLRLGRYVKRIQYIIRIYLFRRRRLHALLAIQRVYRGHYYRMRWNEVVYYGKIQLVNRIKYAWHLYKCRQGVKLMKARQHMARWKIGRLVNRCFEVQRVKQRNIVERARQREEELDTKKLMLRNKRLKMVEKLRHGYHDRMARRIQRAFLAQKEYKIKGGKSDYSKTNNSDFDNSLTVMEGKRTNLLGGGFNPIKSIGSAISGIQEIFASKELIKKRDAGKFVNAVLKYQVKSILQEGVIAIHMTLGEMELKQFEHSQNQLKQARLPYFVKLENDLSGSLTLLMFMWVLMGTGVECICQIAIKDKPDNMSNAAMKFRKEEKLRAGVKITYHPHIRFEIQGSTVKQGQGSFAVQDIKIVVDPVEEEKLIATGHYFLVADMAQFGMHTSVYSTARKPLEEDGMYKFGRLPAYEWFDGKLERLVKGFNLSEQDVYAMRTVFEKLLAGRQGDTFKVTELFIMIDFPYNQLCKWIYLAVEPKVKGQLSFSEYVHMICFYVMFSSKDLIKFLFGCQDDENTCYLRRDQFTKLVEVLAEHSPYNVRAWTKEYDNYRDKKLKFLFISSFEQFVFRNGGVLWRANLLQQKLMALNIGIPYWENKLEQYRITREQLEIIQI